MPCTLREAQAAVKRAGAKQTCKKRLAKAAQQTQRTVACAKAAVVKGHTAATAFKQAVRASYQQAFQGRLAAQRKHAGANAEGRVLNALLAELRQPV